LLAVADSVADARTATAPTTEGKDDDAVEVARAVSDTDSPADAKSPTQTARRHTVAKGESAWTIARRYRMTVADLMQRNGLALKAVLKPGQSLLVDALEGPSAALPTATGSP
jgi:membrane-bound lytic murein transglycosylase D